MCIIIRDIENFVWSYIIMIIHVSHIVGSILKEGGGAKPKKSF